EEHRTDDDSEDGCQPRGPDHPRTTLAGPTRTLAQGHLEDPPDPSRRDSRRETSGAAPQWTTNSIYERTCRTRVRIRLGQSSDALPGWSASKGGSSTANVRLTQRCSPSRRTCISV